MEHANVERCAQSRATSTHGHFAGQQCSCLLYTRTTVRSHGLAAAACHVPQLKRGLREPDVEALLKKVPVKLGAGKLKVSA